jgi:ABC-2 type transport system permease protein
VAGHAVTNTVLEVGIVILAGRLVFGVAWPGDWLALAVFVALGVICFSALGVALAHAIPNFESAPAYVNAVFIPMILIAGVFYDEKSAPGMIKDLAEALPLKHLIDGMSGAMVHGQGLGDHAAALLVLGLWGAAGIVLAVRGFSWEARRQ